MSMVTDTNHATYDVKSDTTESLFIVTDAHGATYGAMPDITDTLSIVTDAYDARTDVIPTVIDAFLRLHVPMMLHLEIFHLSNDSLTITTYITGTTFDAISNVTDALSRDRFLPFQMKPNRHIGLEIVLLIFVCSFRGHQDSI